MNRGPFLLLVVAALLLVSAIVCGIAAIWVIGPNSGRLAGTALVSGFSALLLGICAGAWEDLS